MLTEANLTTIQDNLSRVLKEIHVTSEKYGRDAEGIKLVAVSKTFSVDMIVEAYQAGQKVFGESYPQELRDKLPLIEEAGIAPELHFIGNLQRNKAKYVVGNVVLIHSVSSIKLLAEIDKLAERQGIIQKCLLQFNISGEGSKGGFGMNEIDYLAKEVGLYKNIEISGVMGISGLDSEEKEQRREFVELRSVRDRLRRSISTATELSMGMSGDYRIAIEEGSTILRIGSSIFGKRDYKK